MEGYHIQHVNSTHNRLKKWIDSTFCGVSTKYLQQYLNWYRINEQIKNRNDKLKVFTQKASQDITAYQKHKAINSCYEKLLSH